MTTYKPPCLFLSLFFLIADTKLHLHIWTINNKWQTTHHTVCGYTEFSLPLLSAGTTASCPSSPSPCYSLPIHSPLNAHKKAAFIYEVKLNVENPECYELNAVVRGGALCHADLPPLCPRLLCCWWWTGDYGYPRLATRIQAPGNSISNSINAACMTSPWRRLIGLRHCQHPSQPANERGEEGWGRAVSSLCCTARWVVPSLFHCMAQECGILCGYV